MDATEKLKGSIIRVKTLIAFYREHLGITLDMMDSTTVVTIEDLVTLLEALADRDISIKGMEFKTQKEIEGDVSLAKETIGQQNSWVRGYDKGYKAGRDGELRRVEVLINKYLKGECR